MGAAWDDFDNDCLSDAWLEHYHGDCNRDCPFCGEPAGREATRLFLDVPEELPY